MNKIVLKIAAIVAILIGIMSAANGIRALTGTFDPGYTTFLALISYNVIMGLVSIIAGYLIWKNNNRAVSLSGFITIGHVAVLLSLITFFKDIVAQQSVMVMIFRSILCVVIFIVVSTLMRTQTKTI